MGERNASRVHAGKIARKCDRTKINSRNVKVHKHNERFSAECNKQYAAPDSFWSILLTEVKWLLKQKQTKYIALLLAFNLASFVLLLTWCSSSRSLALQAYSYTVGFNLLSLLTCVLSVWVGSQKRTPVFTFGYERSEVLAVFASTVLVQLGAVFIVKEGFKRLILEQPEIHTGRLTLGAGLAFMCHIVVTYGCKNNTLDHVVAASSSSWLQEHVSDISQTVCTLVPVFSTLLLPRVNPMVLIASAGAIALCITDVLIQVRNYFIVDTLAALWISAMTCATMLPMSIYSGKVLLQTTPSHIVSQLDKCLRETLTIDGVLEFRNEHFWMLSFGKMAGSLHVRVRRDADEQLVLAQVTDRLSSLVSVLTIQVFKDEWTYRQGIMPKSAEPLSATPSFPMQSFPDNVATSNHQSIQDVGRHQFPGPLLPPHSAYSPGLPPPSTNSVRTHSTAFGMPQLEAKPATDQKSQPAAVTTSESFHNQTAHWNHSSWTNSSDSYKTADRFGPGASRTFPQHHVNNLLISGTRTLDAERFFYQPQ